MPRGSEYAMCFLFTILKHSIRCGRLENWTVQLQKAGISRHTHTQTGILTCNRKYLNQSERFISLQHTSKLPMIIWAVKMLLTDRFGIFSLLIFASKKLLAHMDLYVCCFTGPQPILTGHVLQSDVNVEP